MFAGDAWRVGCAQRSVLHALAAPLLGMSSMTIHFVLQAMTVLMT